MEANRLCAQTPAALGDTYDIMSWCVCVGGQCAAGLFSAFLLSLC